MANHNKTITDSDHDPIGPDGLTGRARWLKFESEVAARLNLTLPAGDASPPPQRLSGRALFSRRTAAAGHPTPRSDAERAQKLSGRALMIARQQTGGRPSEDRR
jgi:hypothetical protein